MSSKITKGGEIGNRADGVGNVNATMIRERAAELAVLDGRTEAEVRDEDLRQAEHELRARFSEPTHQSNLAGSESTLQPDEPVGTPGTETTGKIGEYSEESDNEKLTREGIEEAVHDEMLESGKETLEEGAEVEPERERRDCNE